MADVTRTLAAPAVSIAACSCVTSTPVCWNPLNYSYAVTSSQRNS